MPTKKLSVPLTPDMEKALNDPVRAACVSVADARQRTPSGCPGRSAVAAAVEARFAASERLRGEKRLRACPDS